MKQWVHKLLDQFDIDFGIKFGKERGSIDLNEERATVLYLLDVYNKNLFEIENHPVRKVREQLDEMTKGLLDLNPEKSEKMLFRVRQFFSGYRIDEYAYIQKTFEDFKNIIWDFADQLGEDFRFEQIKDKQIKESLDQLREAVEANAIDELRTRSREFIDNYTEYQMKKDERRTKRMSEIKKNLTVVKKQLTEANESLRFDHLTGAHNRKSFEENAKNCVRMFKAARTPASMITIDIDFFKKINDTYGHDIGDFVLKECVTLLKKLFNREQDIIARIGGEEFCVILPDYRTEHAVAKANAALERIRKEVFVQGNVQIRFTVSMGIAEISENETVEAWLKRADTALYNSKNSGRNKYTIAPLNKIESVA